MTARITWTCDAAECSMSATVQAELEIDGQIDGNDQWSPDGWGGLGTETLCPDHERARMERWHAEHPGVDGFA